jgi:hypothetical protein
MRRDTLPLPTVMNTCLMDHFPEMELPSQPGSRTPYELSKREKRKEKTRTHHPESGRSCSHGNKPRRTTLEGPENKAMKANSIHTTALEACSAGLARRLVDSKEGWRDDGSISAIRSSCKPSDFVRTIRTVSSHMRSNHQSLPGWKYVKANRRRDSLCLRSGRS